MNPTEEDGYRLAARVILTRWILGARNPDPAAKYWRLVQESIDQEIFRDLMAIAEATPADASPITQQMLRDLFLVMERNRSV